MPEDRYIQVGNLKTRYWALGDKGTVVILIHGLGVSADIWMHNVEPLAKRHRVYVPDLIGFGRSDKPEPSFSPLDYARFLDDFMNTLNIDRASLVGQSLGGGIALQYTLQFPQKVSKLVLVDSAGLGKEVIWTLRLMSLPLVGELFSYPSRKGVELAFKLAVRNRALITKDFVELYYNLFSQPGFRKFFLRILRLIVNIRGAREETLVPIMNNLHKITQPVLIIWADKDRVLPLKHGYLAKEKLPNARLKIMEECGHIPFFERSDEFNRLVLEFLSE
jgi:4,5:9,10-diseco-3-hydroxy-5,9,17-trioxoandrosta-1(10),2-diene-4-oate hydrolase